MAEHHTPPDEDLQAETRRKLNREFGIVIESPHGNIIFNFTQTRTPTRPDVVFVTSDWLLQSPEAEEWLKRGAETAIDLGTIQVFQGRADTKRRGVDVVDLTNAPLKSPGAFPRAIRQVFDADAVSALYTASRIEIWLPISARLSGARAFPLARDTIEIMTAILGAEVMAGGSAETLIEIMILDDLSKQEHARFNDAMLEFAARKNGHATTVSENSEMPDRFHADRPVDTPQGDDLGRDAVAKAVARNITRVWPDHQRYKRPFAVHLSGRWGSGKSSILNFLGTELQVNTSRAHAPNGWIVVDYNAWQMEDAGPAWWSLRNAVAEQGYGAIGARGRWFRALDWAWRNSHVARPLAIALAMILALVVFSALSSGEDWSQTSPLTYIVAIAGTVGAIGGLLRFFTGFTKSAQETAEAVRDLQTDPTATLKRSFERIIRRIDRPVAIFIDDLDRCSAQFVVDLLQSLQTAYAGVPVLYVIAADRDWIVSAYNQRYSGFQSEIARPGLPLGYLFVKKIFQLSISVPDLTNTDAQRLTRALMRRTQANQRPTATEDARKQRIKVAGNRGDMAEVTKINAEALAEGQDLSNEVAEAITTEAYQARAQHALMGYTHLFDANPRAIKRLINALTFRQIYAALAGAQVTFDVLARWTILSLRFPYSADHLAARPTHLDPDQRPVPCAAFEDPHVDQILDGLTQGDIELVRAFG